MEKILYLTTASANTHVQPQYSQAETHPVSATAGTLHMIATTGSLYPGLAPETWAVRFCLGVLNVFAYFRVEMNAL